MQSSNMLVNDAKYIMIDPFSPESHPVLATRHVLNNHMMTD